jgi:hypothetical protein
MLLKANQDKISWFGLSHYTSIFKNTITYIKEKVMEFYNKYLI